MLATYTCSECQDSWCRDLMDQEIQAYIEAHPELEARILAGDINSVDLGEVLCDGCEDEYYQEEAALDTDWEEYYRDLDDTDEPCEDIEDEIDRKADLMKHGRL